MKDLQKSITVFTALGFTFNPQFTDDTATCMIVGQNILVMRLTHEKFETFTPNPIGPFHAQRTPIRGVGVPCGERAPYERSTQTVLTSV